MTRYYRIKILKQPMIFGLCIMGFLLTAFVIALFWERKEMTIAVATGDVDTLLTNPGHFMHASLIIAGGITLLSFAALFFCNYVIAETSMHYDEDEVPINLSKSLRKRLADLFGSSLETSLALAAKEYSMAEEAKDRALDAAIAREKEFVAKLLNAGETEFASEALGLYRTASYNEYQQFEADLNAALWQLGKAQDVMHRAVGA